MNLSFGMHGLVERHFTGQAGRWSERLMWRHLRGCEPCRSRYRTRAMLEAMAPGGTDEARARLGRSLFTRRPPLLPALGLATALAAGAAALVLVVRGPSEFQERSGGAVAGTGPAINVIRLSAGGAPTRAGAVVHADEALAFTYRNPPATARRFLMIFARDQAGRVFWYWPAWRDPALAPTSVPISPSTEPVELREGVRHPLGAGPLILTALFSDQPLDVNTVEAAVRAGQGSDGSGGLRALAARSGGDLVEERVEVLP